MISEREHTKNKRRPRGWFAARCARCLSSNSLSSVGSTGSVVQNVLSPSRNHSTEDITNRHIELVNLTTSCLSLSQDAREYELPQVYSGGDSNSTSNAQNCVINIGCQRASSNRSICSSRNSLNGHSLEQCNSRPSSSSVTLHKDYTHQVVVVAPITGGTFLFRVCELF